VLPEETSTDHGKVGKKTAGSKESLHLVQILGFELGALCWLGRYSTSWATPQTLHLILNFTTVSSVPARAHRTNKRFPEVSAASSTKASTCPLEAVSPWGSWANDHWNTQTSVRLKYPNVWRCISESSIIFERIEALGHPLSCVSLSKWLNLSESHCPRL
jgi:hypothetical protein